MKNRTGFVSNSSSTSYLIVAKRNQPCETCGCNNFDLVDSLQIRLPADSDYKFKVMDVESEIGQLEFQLEELISDRNWLETTLANMEELFANEELMKAAFTLLVANSPKNRPIQPGRAYPIDERWTLGSDPKYLIEKKIRSLKSSLNGSTYGVLAQIADITKRIEILKSIDQSEEWKLFSIEVSHQDYDMRNVMNVIKRQDNVTVLEEISD